MHRATLLTALFLALVSCQDLVDPRVPIEVELLGASVLSKTTAECVPGDGWTYEGCCEVWYPYIVSSQEELEVLLEPWEPKKGMPDVVGFEDYTILVLHSPWCINQDKSAKTTFYLENDVLLVDVELTPVGIEIEVNSGVAGIYGIPLQHVFDSVEVEFR